MKKQSVSAEEIVDLRERHNLTQKKLAESLYGINKDSVSNWETGYRNCPAIVWWAMNLTWDHVDIWEEEQKRKLKGELNGRALE